MTLTSLPLQQMLDQAVAEVNTPAFIADDPVQFPRQFADLRDIEITSLLCSTIAWGRRPMICRNCQRLLDMMHHQPYNYLMRGDWETLEPSVNIHRTFFVRDLQYYLRGLKAIYQRYDTLEAMAATTHIQDDEQPAWALARILSQQLAAANEGLTNSRCLPTGIVTSALKRLNMALRWLVRDDGIVDLGVWKVLCPSQLFIPIDVHVGRVSRELGLLTRRSTDRRAALELTEALGHYCPSDPVRYDFALFGLGLRNSNSEGMD